ncbi:MAG: hypothetical protein A2Y76_10880 [Planctomycetes bacterium RBG_13_60_9]|nr:MAG: hypothetical protein A2Y76_10880 [Planctomycetes bacterium RBG_13_60_9]
MLMEEHSLLLPVPRDERYLCVPQIYRNRGGNMILMKPSHLLAELSKDLAEPLQVEGTLPHTSSAAQITIFCRRRRNIDPA